MTQHTAADLARFLNCTLTGDEAVQVNGVASPEVAGEHDLIYLDSARNAGRVLQSAARCVITFSSISIPQKTLLLSPNPKLDFSRAAAFLLPPQPIVRGIHPAAAIAPSALLAEGCAVGPFAVIEENANIGEGTQIGAYCFVGAGARVGSGCRLYPRVTLYPGVTLSMTASSCTLVRCWARMGLATLRTAGAT